MIKDCKMVASCPFKNSALFGVGLGPVRAGITGDFETSGVVVTGDFDRSGVFSGDFDTSGVFNQIKRIYC